MPNFRAIKNSTGATRPGYAGTITNLQNVWNTPQNPCLNQAIQKVLAKISLPKEIPISKISNPKNPSIIHVTWNPESSPRGYFSTVLTWPLDSSMSALWLVSHADVLKGSSRVPAPLTSAKFRKVQSALVRSGSLLRLSTFFSAQISRR